jgi:hypothetical protein
MAESEIRLFILVGRIGFRVEFDMVKIDLLKHLSFDKHNFHGLSLREFGPPV